MKNKTRISQALLGLALIVSLLLSSGLLSVVLAATSFFQGFETDLSGWDVFGGTYNPTRVASGTHGVISRTGAYHAEGGFSATNFGGYESVFPADGYITSVAVYLDAAAIPANDTRFDWTSAINNTAGTHRRDFVFNAGGYTDAGRYFVISTSNNAGRGSSYPKNPGRDPFTFTGTGWYTLQHRFYDNGGVLVVEMSLIDPTNTTLHTWTLSDPTDLIGVTVGGHRYGWFASNEFPFLAFDDSELRPGTPPTPKMHVGGITNKFVLTRTGIQLQAWVQVVDDGGNPVPGATVAVDLTVPGKGTLAKTAVTDAAGKAYFTDTARIRGVWQLCVTGVTLAGYDYDPAANVVTCRSWNY